LRLKSYKELEIWIRAIKLAEDIYRITTNGKFSKDFGLQDQIRRATVSVSSNIAEGFDRKNNKEFNRFLSFSKGSLGEMRSQLYIAYKIGYIPEIEFNEIDKNSEELGNQIGKFSTYLKKEVIKNK
jgi:four helix bundle protein